VFLESPCLTKYENRVYFEQVITANLTYGSLIGVEGLQQEELFVWLPIKDIIVDDPSSGLILFDIGLAYKQLSFSLFDVPPHCKPQGKFKQFNNLNFLILIFLLFDLTRWFFYRSVTTPFETKLQMKLCTIFYHNSNNSIMNYLILFNS
jgi:hypothetical protein